MCSLEVKDLCRREEDGNLKGGMTVAGLVKGIVGLTILFKLLVLASYETNRVMLACWNALKQKEVDFLCLQYEITAAVTFLQ